MPIPRRGAGKLFIKGSAVLGTALFIAAARLGARRFVRYEVSGDSMAPTLAGGDCLVVDRKAFARRLPRPGEVVVARDPREPARELVKRVRDVEPGAGAWLEGDDSSASTDSRTFGYVPMDLVVGRVRLRYWPALARF